MKNWSFPAPVGPNGDKPQSSWRSWAVLGLTLVLWTVIAWIAVGHYEAGLRDSYLRREQAAAERDLNAMRIGVTESWQTTVGFLSSLSRQDSVLAALKRVTAPPVRGAAIEPLLAQVSRSFYGMVGDLKIVSIIALVDQAGNCIAASNALTPGSLIGSDYTDRVYFNQSMRGSRGLQFSTGRATLQTGLFISQPIPSDNGVQGVLFAKLDASTLAPWLNLNDSFIVDENGVIMLARDQSLLFKLLPGHSLEQIDAAARNRIYLRNSFTQLSVQGDIIAGHPEVVRLDERTDPVMMVSLPLTLANSRIGLLQPLPRLALLAQDRWRLFGVVAFVGIILQGTFFILLQRLWAARRRRLRAERDLAFHQSAIDATAFAIGIFAEDGHCLAANEAMAALFAVPQADMTGQNFRSNECWQEAGLALAGEKTLDTGTLQRGHWRLVPKFRPDIRVEATLKRFTYQTRNFLLVILVDVTEQHRRDQLLSEG